MVFLGNAMKKGGICISMYASKTMAMACVSEYKDKGRHVTLGSYEFRTRRAMRHFVNWYRKPA